jgi:outer membrane protein OmpA-like peptidoglycan-associated protein
MNLTYYFMPDFYAAKPAPVATPVPTPEPTPAPPVVIEPLGPLPPSDRDKDGIPDDKDPCPDEPEVFNGIKDEDGCPDKELDLITGTMEGIRFDFGSHKLRRDSYEPLQRAAEVLRKYPKLRVRIEGHTDSKGTSAINLRLSSRRAEAVRDYLVSQGIPADRFDVEGFGPNRPVASNDTEEGRAKNRRIDFVPLNVQEAQIP